FGASYVCRSVRSAASFFPPWAEDAIAAPGVHPGAPWRLAEVSPVVPPARGDPDERPAPDDEGQLPRLRAAVAERPPRSFARLPARLALGEVGVAARGSEHLGGGRNRLRIAPPPHDLEQVIHGLPRDRPGALLVRAQPLGFEFTPNEGGDHRLAS